jgi:hypothetical protein
MGVGDCPEFYDTDDLCEVSDDHEHPCALPAGHDGNHECDCGVDWL